MGPGLWAPGLGPWALGIWALGPWALGPGPLGPGHWALGPWALGPWALGPLGPGPLGTGPLGPGPWALGPLGSGPWALGHWALGPWALGPWALGCWGRRAPSQNAERFAFLLAQEAQRAERVGFFSSGGPKTHRGVPVSMLPRRLGASIPAPAEDLHNKNPSLVALGKKTSQTCSTTCWHPLAPIGICRPSRLAPIGLPTPWADPRRNPGPIPGDFHTTTRERPQDPKTTILGPT